MPYVDQATRARLAHDLDPQTPGELNYLITEMLIEYCTGHLVYQRINDCLGALEGAKLEFYRRLAAPYEDAKIKQNGDVY